MAITVTTLFSDSRNRHEWPDANKTHGATDQNASRPVCGTVCSVRMMQQGSDVDISREEQIRLHIDCERCIVLLTAELRRSTSHARQFTAAEKQKAHQRVHHAILSGRLVRPERCEDCGCDGAIVGHHDDYGKPLDVRWLCGWCHRRAHNWFPLAASMREKFERWQGSKAWLKMFPDKCRAGRMLRKAGK